MEGRAEGRGGAPGVEEQGIGGPVPVHHLPDAVPRACRLLLPPLRLRPPQSARERYGGPMGRLTKHALPAPTAARDALLPHAVNLCEYIGLCLVQFWPAITQSRQGSPAAVVARPGRLHPLPHHCTRRPHQRHLHVGHVRVPAPQQRSCVTVHHKHSLSRSA